MTLDLETFTIKDGKTPLNAETFNDRFYAIVLRLHALEQLKVTWDKVVAETTNYGLTRINEAVKPLVDELAADMQALLDEGQAVIDAVSVHADRTDNPHGTTAALVPYDNAVSALDAATLQAAVDALAAALEGLGPADIGALPNTTTPADIGAAPLAGYVQRPRFARTGPTELTLAGGCAYEIGGRIVSTSEDIVYTVTGLSASAAEWQYLYIKADAAGTLTAADLRNSIEAPTWDRQKRGWYNASGDRCIFAVYNIGDGAIYAFVYADGLVMYQDELSTNISGTDVDTTFMTVQWLTPGFCRSVLGEFQNGSFGSDAAQLFYRVVGESRGGVRISYTTGNGYSDATVHVLVDANQRGEVVHNTSNGNLVWIYNTGWFIPEGM